MHSDQPRTGLQSRRALIVDDEPRIAELVHEELSALELTCKVVSSAVEARSSIEACPPDVLVTDICMPEKDGLDLLAHARRFAPHCRVVLITGYSRKQYLARAIQLGAHDYIEKPFRPGQVADAVLRALSSDQGPPLLDRAVEALEDNLRARQAPLGSVAALVLAVEAKDPYTRRHSEQVACYAVHFARLANLPTGDVESIRVASLLHDIGKIGVPDHILTKPGPLTDAEFQLIRRHPNLGSDILSNITAFSAEARLVRHHHERWDGEGYPEGLRGDRTPLGSRIIQLADSIDAMLMERTYKRGYSVENMLDELRRGAGRQFDPDLSRLVADWCMSHREKLFLPGSSLLERAVSA